MPLNFELEIESLLSPKERLEYKEYQAITKKFKAWAEKREKRQLSNIELFSLVSDNIVYHNKYKEFLGEDNSKECIRILLSTDPTILEDKKIIKTVKTWRLI